MPHVPKNSCGTAIEQVCYNKLWKELFFKNAKFIYLGNQERKKKKRMDEFSSLIEFWSNIYQIDTHRCSDLIKNEIHGVECKKN